jgi:hypothetical protein
MEDKYDKETLRTAISEYREKRESLHSMAKMYGVPRTTLHTDLPPLGLQNRGRFKLVFTRDLENQLREYVVLCIKCSMG